MIEDKKRPTVGLKQMALILRGSSGALVAGGHSNFCGRDSVLLGTVSVLAQGFIQHFAKVLDFCRE